MNYMTAKLWFENLPQLNIHILEKSLLDKI